MEDTSQPQCAARFYFDPDDYSGYACCILPEGHHGKHRTDGVIYKLTEWAGASGEAGSQPPNTRNIHTATRTVSISVDVDEGIADLVEYLNTIPGVRTHTSCQGTLGEGGAAPYRGYIETSWPAERESQMLAEFELEIKGAQRGTVYARKERMRPIM